MMSHIYIKFIDLIMKRNRITYSFLVLVLAAILAFTVGSKDATAAKISGDIGFFGLVVPIDEFGNTNPPDDFSVASGTTGISFGGAQVTSATGDFVGFEASPADATFNEFQFTPSIDPDPVDPLWETTKPVGITASFVMTSVTIEDQDVDLLLLNGSGKLNIDGFDETPGIWNFSYAGVNFNNSHFFFSATSSAVIPEPGTLSLLGIGMVGLIGGVIRNRKFKNNKVDS